MIAAPNNSSPVASLRRMAELSVRLLAFALLLACIVYVALHGVVALPVRAVPPIPEHLLSPCGGIMVPCN
jgi:hypothetical protein